MTGTKSHGNATLYYSLKISRRRPNRKKNPNGDRHGPGKSDQTNPNVAGTASRSWQRGGLLFGKDLSNWKREAGEQRGSFKNIAAAENPFDAAFIDVYFFGIQID